MRIRVTNIKTMWLRRLAIVASIVPLFAITFPLALLSNVLHLFQTAHAAWTVPGPQVEQCEVGIVGDALVVRMPLDVLAFATEHSPMAHHLDPDVVASHGGLTVTDKRVFGNSVARALRDELDESGTTLVHQMFDDAVERVVDNGEEGYSWPANGID